MPFATIWNIPADIPINVLEKLRTDLMAEIGNTFHAYVEEIGPDQVTVNFPTDRVPHYHSAAKDVWGEIESGLFRKMDESEILGLTNRVADIVFAALGMIHFVEIFPRALDGKNAGRRKPEPPAEERIIHP